MQGKNRRIVRFLARLVVVMTVILVTLSALPMLVLRVADPPTTSFMSRFEESAGRPGEYQWVDWEDISPHLPLAVMAAEDQRFPKHFGLDLEQIMDAIRANENRATPRGASTITQQTIKNLFLTSDRSYLRKGAEAYLSQGMYEEARPHAEAAATFAPQNAEYHNQLGFIRYVLGDDAGAIESFEQVLSMQADQPDALSSESSSIRSPTRKPRFGLPVPVASPASRCSRRSDISASSLASASRRTRPICS